MASDDLLCRLTLTSIPLRKLGSRLTPESVASGCLVDYGEKRILLTVAHATGDMGNWAIEIAFDESRGEAQCYQLGDMHYLESGSLSTGRSRMVDLAYAEVPSDLQPRYQKLTPEGRVEHDQAREILVPDFDVEPSAGETYGFAGQIRTALRGRFLLAESAAYYPLTFDRREGDYFVFRLPFPHPGHEHFEGCSGAPILDSNGRLVALVCHGRIDEDSIYGVSLRRYRGALDILTGQLG